LRTGDGSDTISYDLNGRQTSLFESNPGIFPVKYNWDGKIIWNQYYWEGVGMEAKYTPDGVRIWKKRNWNLGSYEHKYIVDATGEIPNLLLVLDADDNNAILKTYIHANDQIMCQHDGDHTTSRYFYLHDRLGSVRQIINTAGAVVNCYYFTPFGSSTGSETDETIENAYGWAGYQFEDEADGYYCNARNYYCARFMTRDPVLGGFQEPLTLHAYIYCLNDPINKIDPTGRFSYLGLGISTGFGTLQGLAQYAAGGTPMDILAGALSGAVSGGIGGAAWLSAGGLFAKIGVGFLQGAVASGAGTAVHHLLLWDAENLGANLMSSMILGGALGGIGGYADYKDWLDSDALDLTFSLIGIDVNLWVNNVNDYLKYKPLD